MTERNFKPGDILTALEDKWPGQSRQLVKGYKYKVLYPHTVHPRGLISVSCITAPDRIWVRNENHFIKLPEDNPASAESAEKRKQNV